MMHLFKREKVILKDDLFFNRLRKKQYSNLDEQKQTYLDYTGANLYSKFQIHQHQKMLENTIFGNPHSMNPTSHKSTYFIEEARLKVLIFFNARGYTCVFTQNVSAALKIVGESYPFDESSTFLLSSDNHNSVNGIREYCNNKKGKTIYAPLNYEDLQLNEDFLISQFEKAPKGKHNLFAFPAQSNASGIKHSLKWIAHAQQKGFDVLLDATAFAPTNKLDLSAVKPDFVTISFYKIFGYPTGIGCLLIKNETFNKLKKPWFAGGTVTISTIATQDKFLSHGSRRFEDGTLDYASIPAIQIGIDYIQSIGLERISNRVSSLIHYLRCELEKLTHENGTPIVKLYGSKYPECQGGNLLMNFFDQDGKIYPYEKIGQMAGKQKISICSGYFCNPGIDETNHRISAEELTHYFRSRTDGDYQSMTRFSGKTRGAIRVSVGLATVKKDLDKFMSFVTDLKDSKLVDWTLAAVK